MGPYQKEEILTQKHNQGESLVKMKAESKDMFLQTKKYQR